MSRRLVALGLLAALSQLSSGCFHLTRCAVARFRANHPCLTCSPPIRIPPPLAVGPVVGAPVVAGPVLPGPGPGCPTCNGGGPIDGLPVSFPGPISYSGGPPPGYGLGGPPAYGIGGPPSYGPGGPADGYPMISGPMPLHNPRIEPPAGGVPGPMPGKNGTN